MNVLLEALNAVDGLIPRQQVTIKSETMTTINGFPVSTETEETIFCHVQPLTPFEIKKLTDSVIGANSYYRFWILENNEVSLVEILSYLNNEVVSIEWGDKKLDVFSKNDWILNGWIEVVATQRT